MIAGGELLRRVLAVRGVDAVYGDPLAGVPVIPIRDAGVARLLAAAHERVHRAPAASHAGGVVAIGGGGAEMVISDAAQLADVAAGPVSLRIDVDLDGPAPDRMPPACPPADRWGEPAEELLACLVAAKAPAVLAGPGVVGAVGGLGAFAAAGNVGVLNTWGAKGVFHWRSRHHWATVGLQADDFRLGGFSSADLIVATGVDEDEAPPERWRLAPSVTVDPGELGPLSERWHRPPADIGVPPLRAGLAAVTQDGWASSTTPLAPTRVTLHYGQVLGSGGLVAADPGISGYWVARTFSTTELGTAQVPARSFDGFAAACVLVARLRRPARPALAVVDDVFPSAAVLEAAAELGVAVPVEVWDPSGPALGADEHLERLRRLAVAGGRPAPAAIATDEAQLGRMVEVAGPVVAWGGLG